VCSSDLGLLALLRREPQPSPTPERLRLRHRDDLGAEPGELRLEQARLPGGAADDHPVDAGAHELPDLVLGKWMARNRHERLRMTARRVTQARRLPAREDDRLHLARDPLFGLRRLGQRLERGALPPDSLVGTAGAPAFPWG